MFDMQNITHTFYTLFINRTHVIFGHTDTDTNTHSKKERWLWSRQFGPTSLRLLQHELFPCVSILTFTKSPPWIMKSLITLPININTHQYLTTVQCYMNNCVILCYQESDCVPVECAAFVTNRYTIPPVGDRNR